MILVISRVRAARFLLPRHLFPENITRGVTFSKKKSSGAMNFLFRYFSDVRGHYIVFPKDYQ